MAKAVITAIGADRPGLVDELSRAVHERGLNIEDSRMAVLGGEFAVIMAVAGEPAALDALHSRLTELGEQSGLLHLFRRTAERRSAARQIQRVRVEAMDHPGIVHAIASFFSERGINIASLETETRRAAHTGTPVFNLEMVVELPTDSDAEALKDAFRSFSEANDLDGAITSA